MFCCWIDFFCVGILCEFITDELFKWIECMWSDNEWNSPMIMSWPFPFSPFVGIQITAQTWTSGEIWWLVALEPHRIYIEWRDLSTGLEAKISNRIQSRNVHCTLTSIRCDPNRASIWHRALAHVWVAS